MASLFTRLTTHCRELASRHRVELALAAAATLFLTVVGTRTPSDVDEGFYALAAELVGHGRMPYRDFFYPQAPYFPFLLAPIARIAPRFMVERVILAFVSGATAGLVAFGVRRATRSTAGAAAAALLYTLHELTWQWGPSVRPYSLAALCATAAALLLSGTTPPTLARCLLAGLLGGVVGGMRLLLLPAGAMLVAAAWLREAERPALRAALLAALLAAVVWQPLVRQAPAAVLALPVALALAAVGRRPGVRALRGLAAASGFALGLAPLAAMAVVWREAFAFNNFAFHADRVVSGTAPMERSAYADLLVGLPVGFPTNLLSASGSEFLLMAVLGLAGVWLVPSRHVVAPLLVAAGMVLAAFIPLPIIEHYFTPAVPLLAILAGVGVGALSEAQPDRRHRAALPVALAVVVVALGIPSFQRRWIRAYYNEWNLGGFRPSSLDAAAARVREVARAHPGPVLALWPGSAMGIATRLIPGTENHFARRAPIAPGDTQTMARMHVHSHADVTILVAGRVPAVVAFDREAEHEGGDALRRLMENCGYRMRAEVEGTAEVYALEAPRQPECVVP